MHVPRIVKFLFISCLFFVCLSVILNFSGAFNFYTYTSGVKDFSYALDALVNSVNPATIQPIPKKLENPPGAVKSIYMTGWSAGSKNYIKYVDELLKTTQINAVVIDVKDSTGLVSYASAIPNVRAYKAYYPKIPDINALVNHFHDKGVYVIGRIVVFEDSVLAKNRPELAVYNTAPQNVLPNSTTQTFKPILWQDNNGLLWLDPASKEVWDYNIAIAKEAFAHGFDEINFDYIRFPTDGNTKVMGFPIWNRKVSKSSVIKNLLTTVRQELADQVISIDIFGQVASTVGDIGIGQILEDSFGLVDYVCPMMYPSHYVTGFLQYKNPADHPYEIVKYSMDSALARQIAFDKVHNVVVSPTSNITDQGAASLTTPKPLITKIRPWIQDFDLGALYDGPMVLKEIQAVGDAAGNRFAGFMLWNPSNFYTQEAVTVAAFNF